MPVKKIIKKQIPTFELIKKSKVLKRLLSISLLFIFGMMIFPWRLVCIAHPFGHSHEHHEPGKPTPCELHRMYAGKVTCFLPPMHCKHLSPDTDNYQTTEKFQIKPTFQTLAFAAVVFQIIKVDYPEQPFIIPHEPNCRSAPILSVYSLRAPPFC